jgi:transmembrane sensor
MTIEEAKQLLIRYNVGECTEEEKLLVENSFFEYNEQEIDISEEAIKEIGEQIYENLPFPKNVAKRINLWRAIGAIAAISLLSVCTWIFFDRLTMPPRTVQIRDISPGGNKATITLGSGKTIRLSGSKSGIVIENDNLTYLDGTTIDNIDQNSGVQMLTTPKGGQYQIQLPDGTKVWLNANSSLKYPTSFVHTNERNVELQGEAYFEVSPNKAKPFIIRSNSQTVKVLGTHFNINNYQDNGNTITTLVEGSVKVTNPSLQQAILKPNQQSIVRGNIIKVQDADIETALAWKNGRLEFKDADLKTILKQVARWYDIEIEYRGEIPNRTYNGSISRSSNLSVLLDILAYSDIHFTIERQHNLTSKLIVTP